MTKTRGAEVSYQTAHRIALKAAKAAKDPELQIAAYWVLMRHLLQKSEGG
jgi:hypothetical protein